MKHVSLLRFSALTLVGVGSVLFAACSSDSDRGGGGAGTSSGGHASAGMSAGGASAGMSGEANAGTSEGGAAGEQSSGGVGGVGDVGGLGGEGASDDGGAAGSASSTRFTVTLENIGPTRLFTSAGVFNTPVGDAGPGPATPGKMYQFTIDAGRKQRLSFATMLAATNDLFFAPEGVGIALYDAAGAPLTGDVTSQIRLWDAGTEVNEEPIVGPNTVSKQAAANTGPDEHGNVVDIANATDGVHFDYPAVADVIQVTVTHSGGTHFLITIKDVSTSNTLVTSMGNFAAPVSPGVWVVHNAPNPLFTVGMPDRGQGLERIAEDGNPAALGAFVAANAGITYPASPGVWVVHRAGSKPLFTAGMADYGAGIEAIAEDGNPAALGANLSLLDGERAGAIFNTPVGASSPGPILPGSRYRFSFEASPGDALSFASMLAATNDVFFGPSAAGIPLFDASGAPISGDVSGQISLWDAGSEGNEEPGIGPNTVTNQLAPNTGTAGEGKVQLLSAVNDGFTYPMPSSLLKVSIAAE
ncbi:MAG TPA: spondin domain-containing protein [Polyangiaceae bacterium]|nr:spondin domain-containing protein [Polyangiaceae bacterium]